MSRLEDVLEQEMKLYQKDIRDLNRELRKYKILEAELGIDLITLFKALKDGIWFNCDDLYDDLEKNFSSRPRLYYSDDFKCYCFEISFGSWVVKLKDFNKTWWIDKPKENDDD